MDLTFAVIHNLVKENGEITQCDISMGKAVAHLTGSYDAHGKVTSVNLKLNGQGMPVDDLEAMLPAVGVDVTPEGNVKGGNLNVTMASSGPVDKLVTTGTVKHGEYDTGRLQPGIEAVGHFGPVRKEHRQRHHDSEFQL